MEISQDARGVRRKYAPCGAFSGSGGILDKPRSWYGRTPGGWHPPMSNSTNWCQECFAHSIKQFDHQKGAGGQALNTGGVPKMSQYPTSFWFPVGKVSTVRLFTPVNSHGTCQRSPGLDHCPFKGTPVRLRVHRWEGSIQDPLSNPSPGKKPGGEAATGHQPRAIQWEASFVSERWLGARKTLPLPLSLSSYIDLDIRKCT